MKFSFRRLVPLLLLGLTACFGPIIGPDACTFGTVVDPLADIDVKSAHFDIASLRHDELVEGNVDGTGVVVVIDTAGAEHDFAATITGSIDGAGIDGST